MCRPRHHAHREIVALAIPAMAALAADPLLGLVDTALVGRLGRSALAALGVDMAVFAAIFWVFNFLTYGTTAEVARLRGAGRPAEATRHVIAVLWLAVALGALVTAVLLTGGPLIVRVMGADAPVAPLALTYLRVRALAAIPVLIVAVGHGAFRGCKDLRTPLWIAAGANAANAILAWMLIYPAWLGVAGAAWGTLLAQTGAAWAFLVLGRQAFPPPGSLRVERAVIWGIVRISTDLFLRTGALLTGLLIATAAAARMGTLTIAAHQIARELWVMLALVLDGFAIAGQAMIGTALGTGQLDQAHADARRLVWWGLGAGTVIGVAYLALAGPLPRVFTTDGAVLEEVRGVWWIVAALQPIGGVVFVLDGILMGAGDFRFLLVTTGMASLVGLAPIAVLALTFGWGLAGVWAGMAALMTVRLATTVPRLLGGQWLPVPAPTRPLTT